MAATGKTKKYKSGAGNWQTFSWDEPTEENGALAECKDSIIIFF